MKIIPLSEGSFTVDRTKLFLPFNEGKDDLQARSPGSLLVEIQPFLVITSKDILLLDTGLGFTDAKKEMQIYKNMRNEGINPSDITKILLSHLHKDHAGGISESKEHSRLSFPNATYYVQERELNFAFEKACPPARSDHSGGDDTVGQGFPSFIVEDFAGLKNSKQVILLNDDAGVIDDCIYYEVTKAHSPYHQVFWIKENNKTVFFGGDDAPQLQQMKHRFVAKYDFDGKKAMELRQGWLQKGRKEDWTFLFYHDIKTPIWNF